jgi:hypothetical protein
MAQAWEQALVSYKTDPTAAAAELLRAQGVYTAQMAAGNTAGADAAHLWANQIRLATGTSTSYNDVTGALLPGKTGIVSGQPVVVPTVPAPAPGPAPTPVPIYTGTPVQPTVVQPYVQPAAAAPVGPTVAANQVAQTAYYQASNALANDSTMMKAFLAENPWANPDNNQWDQSTAAAFSNWADLHVQQLSAQYIVEHVRFDATKEPWWPSYVDMLESRDALTKASLKTALDLKINATQAQQGMAAADYDFQVKEIDNALNLANWSTREEMATSNVWIAGALNWAVVQNETKGLNDKSLALAQRGVTIAKLANDITILTSDYANQGTLIDAATIAEIGAKREYFLSGNIEQYNTAMALVTTLQGAKEAANISAPGTVKAGQAAEATATQNQNMQTAAFLAGLVQEGIYLTQNNDGTYGYKTGLTADQQLAVNTQLFQQWYQTQGLNFNYAQLASDQTQQQFTNWAVSQGLNLDVSKQNWQQVVDTAGMNVAQQGANVNQQNADLNQAQFDWSKSTDAASIYGQYGITLKTDSTGKITGMNRVLTPSEKLAIQNSAYDYWYKKQSIAQGWQQLTDNEKQNQFSNWATSQGIALNSSQLAETIRSHKVTEGIDQQNANTSQQNANTAAAGAGATVVPYDQAKDLAIVNSKEFTSGYGSDSAPYLRLLANSGLASQSDDNFNAFLNGTPSASQSWITTVGRALWNPINPKIVIKPNTAVSGALALPEADFNQVLQLIKDPVRQGEAYALWAVKNNLYTTTADAIKEVAQANGWTAPQTTLALKFLGGK